MEKRNPRDNYSYFFTIFFPSGEYDSMMPSNYENKIFFYSLFICPDKILNLIKSLHKSHPASMIENT